MIEDGRSAIREDVSDIWPRYTAASLGLRNYWYPVMWSSHLGKQPRAITLCGERIVLVRDQGQRAHRPPGALVHPDGDTEIFVPIRRPIRPNERIVSGRLPACRAATVMQRGPYDGIAAARRTLETWIAAAGLVAAGPLRIIYLQFGAEPELQVPRGYVVDRAADLVTELQLPVA